MGSYKLEISLSNHQLLKSVFHGLSKLVYFLSYVIQLVSKHHKLSVQTDLTETPASKLNLLKPTGYVMHQQFNIQQLYVLPTLYLCVLYLSENKERLVPLTA